MPQLRQIITSKPARLAALAACLMAAVGAVTAWRLGLDWATLKGLWHGGKSLIEAHPWALFLALVFLPGLPVPVSALLLAAGIVWRANPVSACLLSLLALTINMTWTYWVAAGPARRLIEMIIRSTSLKIPDLPRQDHLRLILVLRLTPGIPLFFQNYLLGFLRAPFQLYLPLSVALNGLMSSGIVLVGAGASDGRFAPAVSGVALVVVAVVLTRWLRAWLERRKATVATAAEPDPAAEI
jgi:uncharacterized membrane protein YdjX (TVP38/TMEM64 family)